MKTNHYDNNLFQSVNLSRLNVRLTTRLSMLVVYLLFQEKQKGLSLMKRLNDILTN